MTNTPAPIPERTREVHLVRRPVGMPKPSDLRVVDVPITALVPGEVLVRNTWLSVDPYMRGRMDAGHRAKYPLNAALGGRAIGEVIASRSDTISVGSTIRHLGGWREHARLSAGDVEHIDLEVAPAEMYLGPLGIPGLTAYSALTRAVTVDPGDVVYVSGAAGAVGLVASAIARSRGAKFIIGSSGGPEKARRLVDELGYDVGIDYHNGSLVEQLRDAAPEGIDLTIDNVGGSTLWAAIEAAGRHGRIALCGYISEYNMKLPVFPTPSNLSQIVEKHLTVAGIQVSDHLDLQDEWYAIAAAMLAEGTLRAPLNITEGLDSAIDAFLGLFAGLNIGKSVISLE